MEYHNLIIKFFAGEISNDEMILLKSWLDKDPENRRYFDEENELFREVNINYKYEQYDAELSWKNISSSLGFEKGTGKSVTILSKNSFRILIAAAVTACLIGLWGLNSWMTWATSFRHMATTSTIVKTKEGEKARIFLADSTEIILNSGSSVQYDGRYNIKDRTVILSGEAYFDVHTNPEKPFVVKLNQMSIIATGTRFNVFSFSDEDRIVTTLDEGKIQISIKGEVPINIKSGQQVVYYMRTKKVMVNEVVADTYTSWKENKLRFHDTSFEEVLREIGRRYNVTFEIKNRDLLNLRYTATFIDESIEEVMQMLKTVSPIDYTIYKRASANDKQYIKPKIVIEKRRNH